MLVVLVAFFFLALFPIMGWIGAGGFTFLSLAVPFMAARWWLKYGSLRTADLDFPRARITAIWVSALAALLLLWRLFSLIRSFGH